MNTEIEENDFYQEGENLFDFKSLIPKIFRIWPWILGSLILSLGIAYYLTKTTSPYFRVSSKFFIKENESGLSLFENPAISQEQGL
ncbi:hypothetical protein, partial [Campylobacter fetus]